MSPKPQVATVHCSRWRSSSTLVVVFASDARRNEEVDTLIANQLANTVLWSRILGNNCKTAISSTSGKDGIFAKSSRRVAS